MVPVPELEKVVLEPCDQVLVHGHSTRQRLRTQALRELSDDQQPQVLQQVREFERVSSKTRWVRVACAQPEAMKPSSVPRQSKLKRSRICKRHLF